MRVCPTCSVAYQDDQSFCPKDGTALELGPDGALSETALGPGDVRDTPLADPPVGAVLDDDPMIGRVVGGLYRIIEQIGRGGMGVVYLVEHVHLGKKFALKVLSRSVARNASAIDRLRQEAIAASRIEHENIVDIVSFDTTPQGDVFIVMEYLKGQSLARLIEQGRMPTSRALEIAVQIARALQAAHDQGIIHRDIKPENVFICQRGSDAIVKVLDFGISKVKDAETERVRMTKTGELVGTPLYMAPEQARGETKLDARADVYALGVILFEMLTGKTPFTGENYFQLLWKHSNEQAPTLGSTLSGLVVPPALEAAVARALAKEPADRFSSMQDFEDALTAIAAEAGMTVPARGQSLSLPPGAVSTQRGPARTLGLVAIAAALVVGLGFLLLGRADPPTTRGNAHPARNGHPARPGPSPAPSAEPASDPRPAPQPGAPSDQRSSGVEPGAPSDQRSSAVEPGAPSELRRQAPSSSGVEPGAPSDLRRPAPGSSGVESAPTVAVALTSTPSGAEVFRGEHRVGATPTIDRVPRSEETLEYRFALRGYREAVQAVVPTADRTLEVLLKARPRAGSSSPPPGIKGTL